MVDGNLTITIDGEQLKHLVEKSVAGLRADLGLPPREFDEEGWMLKEAILESLVDRQVLADAACEAIGGTVYVTRYADDGSPETRRRVSVIVHPEEDL